MNHERDLFTRFDSIFNAEQIETFAAVEPERGSARVVFELTRQHAHAHQIAAMNSFETLRDDCLHAEQTCSFRGPIARASRAVFLTRDYHKRYAFRLITHRGVVNTHAVFAWMMNRYTAFDAGHHQVLDAHVGKRAAHHHLMIAAPRAVAVEVFDVDALILQIQTGRRRSFDCAGRTDVVRRH